MTISKTDEPLLTVTNLVVDLASNAATRRRRSVIRAVAGVDLSITSGETMALVGESGCGKSTLAYTVMGIVSPASGSIRVGELDVVGANAADLREIRRQVQMVFQDPYGSLNPRRRIGASIAEPMLNYKTQHKDDVRMVVDELLDQVGLDVSVAARYPDELSGGQLQRVCIARAIATKPRLLICDEATSSLDVSVQAQILQLLRQIQESSGISLLFITHNLAVVRQLCARTTVMYLGKIVEVGSTSELFGNPQHPYTKALVRSAPDVDSNTTKGAITVMIRGETPSPVSPPQGCRFHPRCPLMTDQCINDEPFMQPLSNVNDGRQVACWNSRHVQAWNPTS